MIQRNEAVLSILTELQEATESSGLDALILKALEVDRLLAPFPLPRLPCQNFPSGSAWTTSPKACTRRTPLRTSCRYAAKERATCYLTQLACC